MSLKVYGSDHSAYDLTETAFAVEGGTRIKGTAGSPVDMDSFWRFGCYYAFYDADVSDDLILNLPKGLTKAFTMKVIQSSGMTENAKHFYPLQEITVWDGSAIYRRSGTIYINNQGAVTKNEWGAWNVEWIKKPIPEDQLSYMRRMFKYGDIDGGSSNNPIAWSSALNAGGIKNPAYLGGYNLIITDIHRASNIGDFSDFVVENADLITAVVNCGDNFKDSYTETGAATWLSSQFTPAMSAIIDAGVPYISCVGNHDANNASIDDLVSVIRPKAMSFDVDGVLKAGIFGVKTTTPSVTYGYFSANEEIAALKARHLGYLYVIENKVTGYIQPYLVLNEYDMDRGAQETLASFTSRILRSASVDTREEAVYISQEQAMSLLEDLEGFYNSYITSSTTSKVLPLITISHFIMNDNSTNAIYSVGLTKKELQNQFSYSQTPERRAISAYSHRFQSGGGNWTSWSLNDTAARITYLGMVAGLQGLSSDDDVAVRGVAVSDLQEGKTSDWEIIKRTMDVAEPVLCGDLYKRIGIGLAGHSHTDYVYVTLAGKNFTSSYSADHIAGIVLSSYTSISTGNGSFQQKTNDIVHDDFYKFSDLIFTGFGYTASGYKSTSGIHNESVEWMLVRFGERKTMGEVDRSVDFYGYKSTDLVVPAQGVVS